MIGNYFAHSRKSLLFDKGNTWMKKGGDIFDVAMGAYDGAEVCELVGTFLLEKISEICNKSNIGLYRDDGLSIFRNKSGTQLEKMKKKLQRLFKEYDLEITAESNLKIVNYLDVTFNLKDALLDLTINLTTKYSTYIRNPTTP